MQFTRETQRLLIGFLLIFGTVAIVASYWSITGPITLLSREDNARLVEDEAAIVRGTIYDRHGEALVESVIAPNDVVSRAYLYPEIYGITGYYSLRYGVGGAEAAYDEILRGDDLPFDLNTYFERDFLHLPQSGSDLRLTLDLNLQQQLYNALGDRFGGAVVVSVPDGEVIALVSKPTFDPNTLDDNWDTLIEDETKPFFSRVLQAEYQPGGINYLALLTGTRPNNIPLTTVFTDADRTVSSGGVDLGCLITPPQASLTLNEAFVYGCPGAFADLTERLTPQRIDQILQRIFTENPITLDGFITEPEDTAESTPQPLTATDDIANSLGQGELTLTPMQVTALTTAILNAGNAPQPYALREIQLPDSETWDEVDPSTSTYPLITEEAAQLLRQLMFEAVENGTARTAAHENLQIGGYATVAYSGEQTLSWFTGFIMTDISTGYAITILLEDTNNFALAAEIGGDALASLVD